MVIVFLYAINLLEQCLEQFSCFCLHLYCNRKRQVVIGEYSPRAPEGRVTGDNMTMSQPVPFIQKATHEEGGLGKSKLNRCEPFTFVFHGGPGQTAITCIYQTHNSWLVSAIIAYSVIGSVLLSHFLKKYETVPVYFTCETRCPALTCISVLGVKLSARTCCLFSLQWPSSPVTSQCPFIHTCMEGPGLGSRTSKLGARGSRKPGVAAPIA